MSNSVKHHQKSLDLFKDQLEERQIHLSELISKIAAFQIAVPSWALGAGGTRFGRFSIGGEPRNLEEKLEDIGLLARLTKKTDAVSLHIPWDIPKDVAEVRQQAAEIGVGFDAMNSNTFQDYGAAAFL
jgi:L-rhamnose isomerase/sugar isomerase